MQSRSHALSALRAASWLVGVYGLFVVVGATVGGIAGEPEPWERALIRDVAAARTEATGRLWIAITHLGDALTVTIGLAALAVTAAVKRARGWAPFFGTVLLGAVGIHPVVKSLLERPRPQIDPFIDVGGYAFPSGHAAAAAALATAIAVFLLRNIKGQMRTVIVIAASVYAAAVGISRVALGVHWPTDVLGGWIIGATWVFVIAHAIRRDGVS